MTYKLSDVVHSRPGNNYVISMSVYILWTNNSSLKLTLFIRIKSTIFVNFVVLSSRRKSNEFFKLNTKKGEHTQRCVTDVYNAKFNRATLVNTFVVEFGISEITNYHIGTLYSLPAIFHGFYPHY